VQILLANDAIPPPLRLTNGGNQYEGRVEVFYNGQWGTVCDHNWDIVDARYKYSELRFSHSCFCICSVVCRQLGFGNALNAYTDNYFSNGSFLVPIWLDEVQCSNRDHYLSGCSHSGWGNNNCGHHEDAGIACYGTGVLQNSILLQSCSCIIL